MITQCLRRAFRCYGSGIAAVSAPLATVGAIGLWQRTDFGPVFLLAALGAVMVFMAMGARCPRASMTCPDCC